MFKDCTRWLSTQSSNMDGCSWVCITHFVPSPPEVTAKRWAVPLQLGPNNKQSSQPDVHATHTRWFLFPHENAGPESPDRGSEQPGVHSTHTRWFLFPHENDGMTRPSTNQPSQTQIRFNMLRNCKTPPGANRRQLARQTYFIGQVASSLVCKATTK